jgi:tetratricopeptide (TPR) repeat protein
MFRAAVALLTAVTLTTAPAHADSRALATAYFNKAEALYKANDYVAALEQYVLAYEAEPLPALVFNMAQCFMGLEEYEQAIGHYTRFLQEAAPSHGARGVAKERLKQARALLAKRNAESSRAGPPLSLAPLEDPAGVPAEKKPMYLSWWFWTVVGGVALVAGTTAWLLSGDRRSVQPSGSLGTIDTR